MAMASRWVWCIFQLPEISGLRASAMPAVPEGLEPRQVTLLEVLERRPPAGREVVDPVSQAEGGQGAGTVPSADHGEPLAVGDRLGHGVGAGGEAGVLEDTHRPVPEDRARAGDPIGKFGGGARSDVEADPTVRQVPAQLANLAAGLLARAPRAARGERGDVHRDEDLLAVGQ